jgi:hypothetical protein
VADSLATFWIGRNPHWKRLPFVLRVPVANEGRLFLAAGDDWPRGKDVFCRRLDSWPDAADVLEEVPVEACWRVGAAVHLTLRRVRARRSLFVWTRNKVGRELIFWRSQSSMHAARPGIRMPHARGLEGPLEIAIDLAERYPWRFAGHEVSVKRRGLPVGDYAIVRDDLVIAAVERKTSADFANAAVAGQLNLALGDLGKTPHAALVIEGRLSDVIRAARNGGAKSGWILNVLTALQISHPTVMWMFAETPRLAQEWAYRWLAAASRAERSRGQPAVIVLGAPALQTELPYGPSVLDAASRRALLAREALSGTSWTRQRAAERCRVTPATAAADLRRLLTEGVLRVVGTGRKRTYVAGTASLTLPR